MGIIDRFKSLLSTRGKAISKYRAGITKANIGNYADAIRDYTAAIESSDCPPDVKGMATYNRALAYAAIHEDEKAADDLAALLEMPDLPDNIKTQAQHRRERLRRRAEKIDRQE